ncbi:helix-turn-helix domain-containing protein, partial [Micromonospora zhanjiangensis]
MARIYSEHLADFDAWARISSLGAFKITSFGYPSLRMSRTDQLIRRSDPEIYQLAIPVAGRSIIIESGRQSVLRPGDLTFIDTSRPHEAVHQPAPHGGPVISSSITMQIPDAALPLPRAKVERQLGVRLPADEGIGALLAPYVRRLAEHPEQYRAADAEQLGNVALDLVAALLAERLEVETALPGETRQTALRARVHAFIDENLGDPALGPSTVAAAHHISLRTLHRLFAAEETTVAGEIRLRRLRRCRRDLDNPRLRHQPVHAIAARWGFRDKAHFSRLFTATYGMGPPRPPRWAAPGRPSPTPPARHAGS